MSKTPKAKLISDPRYNVTSSMAAHPPHDSGNLTRYLSHSKEERTAWETPEVCGGGIAWSGGAASVKS